MRARQELRDQVEARVAEEGRLSCKASVRSPEASPCSCSCSCPCGAAAASEAMHKAAEVTGAIAAAPAKPAEQAKVVAVKAAVAELYLGQRPSSRCSLPMPTSPRATATLPLPLTSEPPRPPSRQGRPPSRQGVITTEPRPPSRCASQLEQPPSRCDLPNEPWSSSSSRLELAAAWSSKAAPSTSTCSSTATWASTPTSASTSACSSNLRAEVALFGNQPVARLALSPQPYP